MDRAELDEIVACLPRGRTLFHDFPDRYALWLLSRAIGTEIEVRAIKADRFAKLLNRPAVKEVASAGGGRISAASLDAAWPERWRTFRLTLGRWGAEPRDRRAWMKQTTRRGWNLVLQLNFTEEHNRAYRRLVADHKARPFEFDGHPIAGKRGLTLAWSRIDVDLIRGEALIEELQNDWLRYTERRVKRELNKNNGESPTLTYLEDALSPYRQSWPRTLLLATLHFLVDELGVRRIHLHHHTCGADLKQIWGRPPPVSLYKSLPPKFCFVETGEGPSFLYNRPPPTLQRLEKTGRLRFWRLDL